MVFALIRKRLDIPRGNVGIILSHLLATAHNQYLLTWPAAQRSSGKQQEANEALPVPISQLWRLNYLL